MFMLSLGVLCAVILWKQDKIAGGRPLQCLGGGLGEPWEMVERQREALAGLHCARLVPKIDASVEAPPALILDEGDHELMVLAERPFVDRDNVRHRIQC